MKITGHEEMQISKTGKKGSFFFRTTVGRSLLALALLSLFLIGYATASSVSVVGRCQAANASTIVPPFGTLLDDPAGIFQIVTTPVPPPTDSPAPCHCVNGPVVLPSPCDYPGETGTMADWLEGDLRDTLKLTATSLEQFIGNWLIDGMMGVLFETLNQAEMNLIDWWDTFWFYNLLPSMQDMTKQISVNYADEVRAIQTSVDGQQGGESQGARKRAEIEARKTYAPSEGAAVMATMMGGQERASAMGQAMQKALQDQALSIGLNQAGTPSAAGYAAAEHARQELYEKTFCDPRSNGGGNICQGANPDYYNIDTQITKQIYAKLTIDLIGSSARPSASASADPGFKHPFSFLVSSAEAGPPAPPAPPPTGQTLSVLPTSSNAIPVDAVSAMLENMVGSPAMDPIPSKALRGAAGEERFLKRRPWLARYAAVRSVPEMVVGRRMPGSKLGPKDVNPWVADLRGAAGVPPGQISDNPSYREVMHALTVDRFNSGKFAAGQITDESAIEKEKLIMNSLFLMQLRDYYELLERTALTLSVQVSMMADDAALPGVRQLSPVGK
jgi:hypothetical protein